MRFLFFFIKILDSGKAKDSAAERWLTTTSYKRTPSRKCTNKRVQVNIVTKIQKKQSFRALRLLGKQVVEVTKMHCFVQTLPLSWLGFGHSLPNIVVCLRFCDKSYESSCRFQMFPCRTLCSNWNSSKLQKGGFGMGPRRARGVFQKSFVCPLMARCLENASCFFSIRQRVTCHVSPRSLAKSVSFCISQDWESYPNMETY